MKLRSDGTEYFETLVRITNAGVEIDPSSLSVQFAFPLHGVKPVSGDWTNGVWMLGVDDLNRPVWFARILIGSGTGGLVLDTTKEYDVHWRVVGNPETIPRKVCLLKFD